MQEHLHINREGSDADSLFVLGGRCVLMLYIYIYEFMHRAYIRIHLE